jgi:uncharacterized protein (DUF1778 family)
MPTIAEAEIRLGIAVPSQVKELVEEAAGHLGQTVEQFAASTLTRAAHEVIQQHDRTELSNRDRDLFLALLDDAEARPNAVLCEAAQLYTRQVK